jgi:hypothetical protein
MALLAPLINGESYSWSQIVVAIGGVPVAGITELSYKEATEKENIYGQGSLPVSRGYGNTTYEGSITLLMEEVQALIRRSPSGRLSDYAPFDVTVSYLPKNGLPVKHVIQKCEFLETNIETAQGETSIEVAIPLVIGFIKWK